MKRFDLIIIGAVLQVCPLPISAAKNGVSVIVFDENSKLEGSSLNRSIRFFGSKEHKAKIRGFRIGEELLKEAEDLKVTVVLNAIVTGLYQDKEITVKIGEEICHYKGDA